jgi:hypothetical protein
MVILSIQIIYVLNVIERYPRYDGIDSMEFFTPFAGWEEVMIKQTAGDASWCGISQVDTDYSEGEM